MSHTTDFSYDPKNVPCRRLGATGLRVSLFSLGSWLTFGGSVNAPTVKDIVKVAYDNGINTFDTAEIYSAGKAEIELGAALKDLKINRRELVLITKVYGGTGSKSPNGAGLSRKHIVEGVQDSLTRLQTDYVDVILAHRPDRTVPMAEIVRAFNYVIDQGWAFYWGTSEWDADEIEEAIHVADKLGLVGPSADQAKYSLLERKKLDGSYLPIFSKYKYGTTIWSPLEGGLLTGKYNNGVPEGSRFSSGVTYGAEQKILIETPDSEEAKALRQKLSGLGEIAKKLDTTQAVLALAWTAKNPNVSTVILGATKPEQVIENLKAIELLPKLTPEILKEIDELLDNKPVPAKHWGAPINEV